MGEGGSVCGEDHIKSKAYFLVFLPLSLKWGYFGIEFRMDELGT